MTKVLLLFALFPLGCAARSAPASHAGNGAAAEPLFAAEVVGPLTKETALQVVGIFPYEAGETLVSPATEVAAFIDKERSGGTFGREPLQTLLLDPAPASIKAKRLLYVAFGPRADFSLARVQEVGRTAMREALRLGVADMAFAPIARDQGVTTFGADVVATAFVDGAMGELLAERRARPTTLQTLTYEAGPAFVASVKPAVQRGVAAAHAEAQP